MKKVLLLSVGVLLSLFSVSALTLTTVHLSPGGDVLTAFNAAAATDSTVIVLDAEGTYNWSAPSTILTPKTVTIKAASGLTSKPVIQYSASGSTAFIMFYKLATASGTLRFNGVVIDGNDKISSSVLAYKCSTGYNLNVFFDECVIKRIATTATATGGAPMFTYSNTAGNLNPDSLVFKNTIFEASALGAKTTAVVWFSGNCRPKHFVADNCYFKGPFEKAFISNASSSLALVETYNLNHCTFNGSQAGDLQLFNTPTGSTTISNCLFTGNTSATANNLGTGGDYKNHCGIYFAGAANTVYADALIDGTTIVGVDPLIDGSFDALATEYVGAGSDGKRIGFVSNMTGIPTNIKTSTNNVFSVIAHNNSLQVNGVKEGVNFKIYSVTGSEVANGVINNGKVNTQLTKGIYVMKADNKVAKFAVR
ncbi:MAG: hypothetical protein PHV20_02100 [Bacteroidales bacterium]|nr:hypothetical protein [Bacteroidales bacterium]